MTDTFCKGLSMGLNLLQVTKTHLINCRKRLRWSCFINRKHLIIEWMNETWYTRRTITFTHPKIMHVNNARRTQMFSQTKSEPRSPPPLPPPNTHTNKQTIIPPTDNCPGNPNRLKQTKESPLFQYQSRAATRLTPTAYEPRQESFHQSW